MFHSARLKLTAWYLLIIMLVSIFFSLAFYNVSTQEIQRVLRRIEMREVNPAAGLFPQPLPLSQAAVNELTESEQRLQIVLILINAGILVAAGGAGYFLAGRTLRPIQNMVDEQNRFIADASHELRTPLTALRSEMEAALLEKNMAVKNAKILITSNLEEVINLQAISDNLLQLAHTQQAQPIFQEISLLQIIEDTLKKITPLAKERHITIDNEVEDVSLEGNASNLRQLFVILLDNAIKYSPEKTTVSLTSGRLAQGVSVNISDQGIGMSDIDLPHIFDRFYRVDKSRSKTTINGYGLGLSIAKKIIEMHKGTISIKSKIGKGTTFTVTLPTRKN